MKKLIASIGIITALGAGAFALNSVLPAGAVSTVATQASSSSSDPSTNCPAPGAGGRFKSVLDGLVANNTITQSQEDAIIQAFKDNASAKPGRLGKLGPRANLLGDVIQVAADKIGVSPPDLMAALKSGKSVADVANEHNVSPADVQKAIVDAASARIDQAVANGKLKQAMADKIKARLPQLAEKFVNHTKPGC
ncbi:MAG TPA: hypothetical protein VGZ52_04600 [Acidimicrobiales bacterium]|jgi:hypothetical protein|nr:hypothetical protein [Acidimicrobiales bacterium]